MLKIILSILITSQLFMLKNCTETVPSAGQNVKNLEGEYVLKNKFLGDAIDTPCGYASKEVPEISLSIKKDAESGDYIINGRNTVNSYFGKLSIQSIDAEKNIVYIKIGQLGSTKMAGPPELMECETNIFDFLNNAPELRITEENNLNIGVFKKDNIPSRDGGTFFIYERKK
jgi:heat shock protein HslJ